MPHENVEIVRAAMYEVANAGSKLDANFEVLAPEIEARRNGPTLDRRDFPTRRETSSRNPRARHRRR